MANHDSDSDGSERAGEPGESVAGRSARVNVKRPPSNRTPTRSAGHIRAGAKALSREAQKILRKHRMRLDAEVATEIDATIAEMLRHFETLLWEVSAKPEQPIRDIPLTQTAAAAVAGSGGLNGDEAEPDFNFS